MNAGRKLYFFSFFCIACFLMPEAVFGGAVQARWIPLTRPDRGGVGDTGPYDYGVMGPPATGEIVKAAERGIPTPVPPGPFEPTWESLKNNYRTPSWFDDAKFGIFMHWGLYSVPAYRSEWYEKHMYGALVKWHTENFGTPEQFGYKDFIPLFTAAKWDPDTWAELFKKSGARLVMPCAQHHDNFALWDSEVTKFNAKKMGPKRDLIGELGAAVRRQGIKFGVSNHGIENFTFIDLSRDQFERLRDVEADLFSPEWAAFYNVADRSDEAQIRFLTDWVNRNLELIDRYQPDILWFDNGVNLRVLDPLKLYVAAYYYNRARQWNKEVSLSTKFIAYAPSNKDTEQIGSIIDFEKVSHRSPADIRAGSWMVDDPIGSTWGYTEGMSVADTGKILNRLIDTVSKGGFYLLNISPMADGTIPEVQQNTLLGIGEWLEQNGQAIYDTRPWFKYGENAAEQGLPNYHFTVKGDTLYAIGSSWPRTPTTTITSVPSTLGRVDKVELLGADDPLSFTQDTFGLTVNLPPQQPGEHAYVLKITGLKW